MDSKIELDLVNSKIDQHGSYVRSLRFYTPDLFQSEIKYQATYFILICIEISQSLLVLCPNIHRQP